MAEKTGNRLIQKQNELYTDKISIKAMLIPTENDILWIQAM